METDRTKLNWTKNTTDKKIGNAERERVYNNIIGEMCDGSPVTLSRISLQLSTSPMLENKDFTSSCVIVCGK